MIADRTTRPARLGQQVRGSGPEPVPVSKETGLNPGYGNPVSSKECVTIIDGKLCWYCPGCDELHWVAIEDGIKYSDGAPAPVWTWNNHKVKPTITPSLYIVGKCHSQVTNGVVHFFNECSHMLIDMDVRLEAWG